MFRKTGSYQKLAGLDYFIPNALPPRNPELTLSPEMLLLYGQAEAALSQLNEMCNQLPDQKRFIKAYVIKEALLSSEIENIHTTIIEVFTSTLSDNKPSKNTQLVLNYTKALDCALDLLQKDNLPLVNRVILQAHAALMSNPADEKANPGSLRKQSVRVGALIPPPANELPKLMSELEHYINQKPVMLPPLIMAGLAHVQFETIHPFLDGNGRIGRLLIVLMLIDHKLLDAPIIYPSYYFKKHHLEYYQKLDLVRTTGDFEGWINFYLTGIYESAKDAYTRATGIINLELSIKQLISNDNRFIKSSETAQLALNYLFMQPVTSIVEMSAKIGKSYNTTKNILTIFINAGFVITSTTQTRNKLYYFESYLKLLDQKY